MTEEQFKKLNASQREILYQEALSRDYFVGSSGTIWTRGVNLYSSFSPSILSRVIESKKAKQ